MTTEVGLALELELVFVLEYEIELVFVQKEGQELALALE
jgi:hypothetical protein